MDILVRTLEDEIGSFLEENENFISSSEEIKPLIEKSDSFPYLKYLYEKRSIEKMLQENSDVFNGFLIKTKKEERYDKLYKIRIANPLLVGVKKNVKYLSFTDKKKLKEKKIHLDYIVDIEFFEFYETQFRFLKHLFSEPQRVDISTKKGITEMLRHLDNMQVNDFQTELKFLGKNSDDFIEVLDDEKKIVKSSVFTSFMDTEKIHIQLGVNENVGFPIILYYGHGNYYPFSRNISGKNVYDKRLNRIDYLEFSNYDLIEIQNQFNLPENKRKREILWLLDKSQQEYFSHFNLNFSYQKRAQNFLGDFKIDSKLDSILMIPQEIRTKSAALVAYLYFLYNY